MTISGKLSLEGLRTRGFVLVLRAESMSINGPGEISFRWRSSVGSHLGLVAKLANQIAHGFGRSRLATTAQGDDKSIHPSGLGLEVVCIAATG